MTPLKQIDEQRLRVICKARAKLLTEVSAHLGMEHDAFCSAVKVGGPGLEVEQIGKISALLEVEPEKLDFQPVVPLRAKILSLLSEYEVMVDIGVGDHKTYAHLWTECAPYFIAKRKPLINEKRGDQIQFDESRYQMVGDITRSELDTIVEKLSSAACDIRHLHRDRDEEPDEETWDVIERDAKDGENTIKMYLPLLKKLGLNTIVADALREKLDGLLRGWTRWSENSQDDLALFDRIVEQVRNGK